MKFDDQVMRTRCQNVPVKMERVVEKLRPKLNCPQLNGISQTKHLPNYVTRTDSLTH